MVFVTDRARRPTTASSHWLSDLVLLWLGTCVLLVAVILWFDNAQGGLTGNGIFKSMEMKPWVADPRSAMLNASNYLYYPVYGALCRMLDGLGVFAGDPRRQMTILNALSASFCICVVYAMVRRLTGDRVHAFIASAFHVASSFVLFLAITNEDIMPSYTMLFASMALAAVWFARPTPLRIVIVSVIFSIGWLFEWRLMFPTLPAMLAALWLCAPSWRDRFVFVAVFLAGMLGTATVASLAGHGHSGAVGPIELIWTGKAVGSAWAGFSWLKALTRSTAPWPICSAPASPTIRRSSAGTCGACSACWRSWRSPRSRLRCSGGDAVTTACARWRSCSAAHSWRAWCSTSTRSRKTRRCRSI